MADSLEITYTRIRPDSVGTVVKVGDKVVHQTQINPYQPAKIEKFVDQLDKLGIEFEREELLGRVRADLLAAVEKPGITRPTDDEQSLADFDEERRTLLAEMPEDIRLAAQRMLESPTILLELVSDFKVIGIAGEEQLATALYLAATSRLLLEPLSVCVSGASSSGKSFTLGKVASLIPDEQKLQTHSFSANAFFYLQRGSLRHRAVLAGEQRRISDDGDETVKQCLREMLSDRFLCKYVTIKDDNGGLVAVPFHQPGPIAYIDTTTKPEQFAEDANRVVQLHPDESEEQTRRILERIGAKYDGTVDATGESPERIQQKHWAMQRMLERESVCIPFAGQIAASFSTSNLEARRTVDLLLRAIAACTLLHQFQRERDDQGRLLATPVDYEVATSLLLGWLQESLAGALTTANLEFLRQITAHFGKKQFTRTDVKQVGGAVGSARYHLDRLLAAGYVECVEQGHRGQNAAVFRISDRQVVEGQIGLPRAEDLQTTTPDGSDTADGDVDFIFAQQTSG